MRTFTIYGTDVCLYCNKAKALLESMGYSYEFKLVGVDISKDELLEACPVPVRTVPQIFEGDKYVGGYDNLNELLTLNEG